VQDHRTERLEGMLLEQRGAQLNQNNTVVVLALIGLVALVVVMALK
ncbi:hypothetical protein KIPB_005963, partial [Kipferlia bialata]